MERRDFFKVIGAAGAGAGLAGCTTGAAENLIPYVVPPEEIVPGIATWYRTTCQECPAGCGMSIRTREGRAVKAEGNPLSPISHGRLCARGQASLQGLYDPDRVPQALRKGSAGDWQKISWDAAERALADGIAGASGSAVFLTGSYSGTLDRLIDDWCAAMGVERVRFDAFGLEAVRTASRLVYGTEAVPRHDLAAAEVVVTFGADFMETWGSPVDYTHGFVQGHSYQDGRRGRLIAVGPHLSLTGLSADDWIAARAGTEHLVALAMARLVAESTGAALDGPLASVDPAAAADAAGVSVDAIREAAEAFANGGRSVAMGPGVAASSRAGTALATAVALLNRAAGNVGRTVFPGQAERGPAGSYLALTNLLERAAAGEVGALLVHGTNPLHSVPLADAAAALDRVGFIASFATQLDETSARAQLLLPDHHFLEAWGDVEARPGVHSIVQPVMRPVFQTKQTGDVLLSVARRAGAQIPDARNTFYDYLRARWSRDVIAGADEEGWRATLRAGVVVAAAGVDAVTPVPAAGAAESASGAGAAVGAQSVAELSFDAVDLTGPSGAEFDVVVYPSYRFHDGRLANRPWLQELPDPVSKIAWGSWVEMHPDVAHERGLDVGHIVRIATATGDAELPVWTHPGVRPDTLAIQLGQGHENLGRYAKDRGVNAATLLAPEVDAASGGAVWIQARATLEPTGRWERIPYTEGEADASARDVAKAMSLEDARNAEPVNILGLAAYRAGVENDPDGQGNERGPEEEQGEPLPIGSRAVHGQPHPLEAQVDELQGVGGFGAIVGMGGAPQDYPPPDTYYGEYSEERPRWSLAIDMDRCTGCSACMTACYAENNIGIIGPEQVAKGRLLSWIRIERYWELGEGDDGQHRFEGTRFLPMMCQQCGNAPCEPVCPVYAAYHTPEGLNAQVYNRCVGTRYCANNCPYKVRQYNYFTWEWPEPLNWQLNPDVTVREKGVMEKCTFCVQRIRDAQQHARVEDRPVADGEIVPACAQTCPGDAIVFGDIKNPNSRVAQVAASGRAYRVLGELNTQPGVTYLQRVSVHAEAAGESH
ncbi:MAG: molybdopterin dinucleotide binding domain-containing protein [Gemmatimonadota bacterium]